jgi:DNA-binding NarL/FixJ family response regulator
MADGMRSGFYFVAFVDLLGQQAKLARFKGVAPTTDEERAAFRQLVDDTAGVVRNERESVARWLAGDVTDDALAKIERLKPDIALIDLKMPGVGGIEVIRRVAKTSPDTATIVYTGHAATATVDEALDAGTRGLVLKGAPLPDLVRAVEVVADGSVYIDALLGAGLAMRRTNGTPDLSARERDVLRLVSEGFTNEEIGNQLFISPETVRTHVRRAITKLVNATFAARDRGWWGDGTACASDSKKFGSWQANLLTEYHIRYGGPGVMIYWHVERKSLCIYSQLTTCSASEVAAMIEGVLRHCTDLAIDRNYVDTHGATIVAFVPSLDWSAPTKARVLDLADAVAGRDDVRLAVVLTSGAATPRSLTFVREHQPPAFFLVDGDGLTERLGLQVPGPEEAPVAVPSTFVLDANGTVLLRDVRHDPRTWLDPRAVLAAARLSPRP